ncbi:uncharacterized protein LOC135139197 [Zophobas morio]|uniref:uncharacterized protein LOC135139197 n=1 Tax=Zophobas morio TaxID=2755281 RepID=UPI00308296B0
MVTVCNVLVHFKDAEFYAALEISLTRIAIIPDDDDIDIIAFTKSRLDGFTPFNQPHQRGIHLNVKSNQAVCILTIRDIKDFARVETALSQLMGADTDYDPDEIQEGEDVAGAVL